MKKLLDQKKKRVFHKTVNRGCHRWSSLWQCSCWWGI